MPASAALSGPCPALALALLLAAPPLRAAEPLTDAELDAVSAGRLVVTAEAHAMAGPPRAVTETETETFAALQAMRVVTLRRIRSDLVIVTAAEERQVEIGFARAAARAEGTAPRASCDTDLQFSGPPTFLTRKSRQSLASGLASCLCAAYGTFVLPN